MFQDRENRTNYSVVDVIVHLFPASDRQSVASLMMQPQALRSHLAEANELTTDEVSEVLLSFDLQSAGTSILQNAS